MDEPKRGIIYIGNLPYGFYEEGLKGFFGQFGEITRLKVKRSDKNSNPMGYAYIEFDLEKVAKIAAKTMDGHLMNKKILKCKVVKGSSNKIFRKYNITPEFCTGTKRKRRNQYKLAKANEEKILKRIEKSRSRIFKALGSKVGARFLKTSKSVNPENDDTKPTEGIKSSVEEKLQTGPNPAEKKEKKMSKIDTQFKTPEKSDSGNNTLVKDTPKIYMDIEGEDDEIQFKTPPNVIKRWKNTAEIGTSLKKRLNKKDDASSPSNVTKTDSPKGQKKRKRSVTRIQNKGKKLKQDLKGKTNVDEKDKNEKLSSKTNLSKSRANKLPQLKRKVESVADKQTGKSKESKFSIKKIQNIKNQNKKRRVQLISFKKGVLKT